MKHYLVALFVTLVASVGTAAAAEERVPVVSYDVSLIGVVDCADARAVVMDFSRPAKSISTAEAKAAAATFATCERVKRMNVETTNVLRILAAGADMLAAQDEPVDAAFADLRNAGSEINQLQRFTDVFEGRIPSITFDRMGSYDPASGVRPTIVGRTTVSFHSSRAYRSPYDELGNRLLQRIAEQRYALESR
jgi:hypothetical protein